MSKLRSSSIKSNDSEDLPIIPIVLIERLTNLTLEYVCLRSVIRELYFDALHSQLICILDSNPTVSSNIERIELLEMNTRSCLKESPVLKLGGKKEGRSAYNQQSENEENALARKRRSELWRQERGKCFQFDFFSIFCAQISLWPFFRDD